MTRTFIVAGLMAALLGLAPAGAQVTPVCGNGVVEPPETCDDGNVLPGDGCSEACLLENLPPDCSGALPSVDELWPPNHKFASVAVLGVTDPEGAPVAITVTGVTQDESLGGAGSGNTCPDATGVGGGAAAVRSERSGQGDGRVYHVSFSADDGQGGVCAGSVAVCVPHDRGRGSACADGGELVDSTGGMDPATCGPDGCDAADCAPDPDDLDPAECAAGALPATVARRVERARGLLVRVDEGRGNARRLGRRAGRHLDRAAASARRAAVRGRLSGACAGALAERLEGASSCAMCSAS